MQRIICIWLPFLESERVIRRNPDLSNRPFALVMHEANRMFVSALSRSAGNMGFAPGMSLVDVRAAAPDMLYYDADPMQDGNCLRGLLRWASRFTPKVARGDGQNLYLDITGASHLFDGEGALLERIQSQLQAFGFTARLGLADSKAAAWGFAHYGKNQSNIFAATLHDAANDLPVEALQMAHTSTAFCRRLGLKTIGALRALPRATLANRIGLEGMKRIDQFFGEEAEVTKFAQHKERLVEEQQFPDPLATSAGVEAALEGLLEKLCQRLAPMQQGFRKAHLLLERVDHDTIGFSIQLVRPSVNLPMLKRLFSHHFEQLDVGFGIDRMILKAEQTAPISSRQMGLDDGVEQGNGERLDGLINRLSNMFGYQYVQRFSPADSHIPERAFSREFALYSSQPQSWIAILAKRPLRLLRKPVSVLFGDDLGTNVPKTVFWHDAECHLTSLSGPERIEPDWWRDDPHWRSGTRDYWWVKTHFGALLWLYRVSDGQKTQWFVHGLGS